jgi:hypothetical protein
LPATHSRSFELAAASLGAFLIALSAFLPITDSESGLSLPNNQLIQHGPRGWLLVVLGVLIAFGVYDMWRANPASRGGRSPLVLCTVAAVDLSWFAASSSLRLVYFFGAQNGSQRLPFGAAIYVGAGGVLLAFMGTLRLRGAVGWPSLPGGLTAAMGTQARRALGQPQPMMEEPPVMADATTSNPVRGTAPLAAPSMEAAVTSAVAPPTVAAGWYQNPSGPGQRYWDSVKWTESYAQAPPSAVALFSNGRGLTKVSFVLAAVSLAFLPVVAGPIAIVCASVALNRKEPNAATALGVAIVAMIIGLLIGAIVGV